MSQKNIYYVKVEFAQESQAWASGIRNPLCLVIADSEADAVTLMQNYLFAKSVAASVSIPADASAQVGHGMTAEEYLTDPMHRPMKFREIIDAYIDRYNRYEIQVLDERGEIITQNDYVHPENFIQPPLPPKNKFVPLKSEDVDKLDSGIAFVGLEEAEGSQAYVVTAEKQETGNTYKILQCRYKADGALETRVYNSATDTWTAWKHVYTEEAPSNSKYYMRKNEVWKGFTFDSAPKSKSTQLVNSGAVYAWVRDVVSKMYRMCGSASIDTLISLTNSSTEVGSVYNVIEKGTLPGLTAAPISITIQNGCITSTSPTMLFGGFGVGDIFYRTSSEDAAYFEIVGVSEESRFVVQDENGDTPADGTLTVYWDTPTCEVNPGDNVLWTGYYWDPLSHFIDSDLYVKFTDYASTAQAGVLKLYSGSNGANLSGLSVDDSGAVRVSCDASHGTQLTAGGRVGIVSATVAEIQSENQNFKPIVPSTLRRAVQAVTDSEFDETDNPIANKTVAAAVNSINEHLDEVDSIESENSSAISDLQLDVAELQTDIRSYQNTDTSIVLTMQHQTESRYGGEALSNLQLQLPESYPSNYISSVIFTSGETATVFVPPTGVKLYGEDCMDGAFTPIENKRYTVILSFDGVYVSGDVGGVAI